MRAWRLGETRLTCRLSLLASLSLLSGSALVLSPHPPRMPVLALLNVFLTLVSGPSFSPPVPITLPPLFSVPAPPFFPPHFPPPGSLTTPIPSCLLLICLSFSPISHFFSIPETVSGYRAS